MRHGLRIAVIWLVLSIIVELLIGVLPIPSPTGSSEALGEHQTVYMLFYVGAPIFVFIWVMLVYSIVVFRRKPGEPEEEERAEPPESSAVLLLWAGLSFLIVLFLAGWGTFTLHEITSPPVAAAVQGQSGSVRGTPNTSKHKGSVPAGSTALNVKPLTVQVIGQQWFWTFRYPSYGGMESRDLFIPVNTPILFHVTSLDVVHSFWIYQYDVKEDAVPGVDNTVWMLARYALSSLKDDKAEVKCNELCGLWHGYMRNQTFVIPKTTFRSWARRQERYERSIGLLKNLPPYSTIYYPSSNANWPDAPQDQSP